MKTLENVTLSFAGCGFLGIYEIGVASCIQKHAPQIYRRKIAGTSFGALVACALLNDCPLEDCTNFVLGTFLETKENILGPLSPDFQIIDNLRKGLDRLLPADSHERSTGQLHISMTRFPDLKNVVVSEFDSKSNLIEALICSSYVPVYCGLSLPEFRRHLYFDGGFSDNIPTFDENTITISPFAGQVDICPDDESDTKYFQMVNMSFQASMKNVCRFVDSLLPPSLERFEEICQEGYDNALTFLRENEMIRCFRHVSEKCLDCFHCSDLINYTNQDFLPLSILECFDEAMNRLNDDQGMKAKICKSRKFAWIFYPVIFPCSYIYSKFKKIVYWLPNAREDIRTTFENLMNLFLDYFKSDRVSLIKSKNKEGFSNYMLRLGQWCGLKRSDEKKLYFYIFPE